MNQNAKPYIAPIRAGQALLLAAVMLSMGGCSTTSNTSETSRASSASKAEYMFVQSAEDVRVDPANQTIRLVKVNPQIVYFTDRPVRLAGHIPMSDYLKEWTAEAGKDSFKADPPNATLSTYEPGQADNTLAVVKITDPVVEGADLIYGYKLIEGKLPAAGGETALFIDWIGVGGGVGRGFHGVGVGRRGPGVRGW